MKNRNEAIAVVSSVLVVILFFSLYSLAAIQGFQNKDQAAAVNYVDTPQETFPNIQTQDLVKGSGEYAQFGDRVYVHYVGQLKDGSVFDASTGNATPFSFVLGEGEVILGWDVGLVGMQVGGTRRIVVPPEFGYGENEVRDAEGNMRIPAGETLTFDVVLMQVR